MAEEKIREALERHLEAFDPEFQSIWQNKPEPEGFDSSVPYQKAFVLRNKTRRHGLRGKKALHSGIFQVSLCYPSGIGVADVEARAVALQQHFKGQDGKDLILEYDGVRVQILGLASIADPVSQSPYVVPVSIGYQSIN